jgi:hypothetical protein
MSVIPLNTATTPTGIAALPISQRECLRHASAVAAMRRTRHGYTGDSFSHFEARTVFALERAGLVAFPASGITSEVAITDAGRALVEGHA